ncbi:MULTISPECIES: hypothetical protein [Streptomyces]|jgi:hypothetical protein|uniref:hypothetical protein n=1 Tax=Streptomyces TaxID=1883 RepID=UPI001CE2BE43|nr:hypothetical protein [Streptomyces solaniscabiei]
MYSKLPHSARSAVAVSIAALITAAALFGSLAPEATALPVTGGGRPVVEGITVEGPPVDNLTLR